jgi:hypothetical protein
MPKSGLEGRWTKTCRFDFSEFLETAGAHTNFSTSKAETDTPVGTLTTKNPDTLKSGTILRIHLRANWANAVTLTALRFYQAAKAGDYESSLNKLYDSLTDYPAGLIDDDEYDLEVYLPFILESEGTFYFAPEWSGACGNASFYFQLSGETIGED